MNAPEGILDEPLEETGFENARLRDFGKVIDVNGEPHVITAQGPRPLQEVVRFIEKGELFLPLTSAVPHPLIREAALRAQARHFNSDLTRAASLNPHYRTGTRHK